MQKNNLICFNDSEYLLIHFTPQKTQPDRIAFIKTIEYLANSKLFTLFFAFQLLRSCPQTAVGSKEVQPNPPN